MMGNAGRYLALSIIEWFGIGFMVSPITVALGVGYFDLDFGWGFPLTSNRIVKKSQKLIENSRYTYEIRKTYYASPSRVLFLIRDP